MSVRRSVFQRHRALLLASLWCAAMPAFAGREARPGEFPELTNPLPVREPALLLAAVSAPEPIAAGPATAAPATRSQSVTINLINRLVERGVLTKADSAELIKMAEEDAAAARAQAASVQVAPPPIARPEELEIARPLEQPPLFPDANVIPTPAPEESVRVTYIPEVVKAQLRDEIAAEVMEQTRKNRGILPRNLPEWVSRFRVSGDVRIRYEGDYFPTGNDSTGAFPNFNAINTGAPFDVSGTQFSPQLNVDQDRQRIRLRLRVGADIDLGSGFSAGLRIVTGESNSPVSPNQSFGLANNGQGGNFSKYSIFLDRGFLKYELGAQASRSLAVTVGRFENPFFSTDLIYDDDLGFDGVVVQGRYAIGKGVTPWLTAGAFPVFNTDFNFSSNQPAKFKSEDKYLYGGQIGADWKIRKDLSTKLGAAYYYFENIEGKLSDPFTPLNASDAGNTDGSRPSFSQKGNTYRPIRNIVPNVDNNFGTTNQFQFFGLATPFRELAFTGRVDYDRFEPVRLSLIGEYVKNLAFNRGAIERIAINNRGSNTRVNTTGAFSGGDTAWIVGVRIGSATLEKRWDWNLGVNYRYIESDAVVDGFNDSDFGLGGTNQKGYVIGGTLALSPRVFIGLRWLSADEIAGPPLKSDVLQIDINGKF